jgi:hypothetical protein
VLGERPLSTLARELIARERGRSEDAALKSRALDRARAAVERERPSGVGLRLVGFEAGGKRRRGMWRPLSLGVAVIAAAGLAAAGAGFYAAKRSSEPPGPQVKVPAAPPQSVAVGGAVLPAAPSSDLLPTRQAPEPRAAATAANNADGAPALNTKQYASELALLEPARSSISRRDYPAALAAIGRHRREFPSGQLSQEREALRVRALWGLGEKPAALAAARAFRKRYPRSALLSWLKDEGEPAP